MGDRRGKEGREEKKREGNADPRGGGKTSGTHEFVWVHTSPYYVVCAHRYRYLVGQPT